MNVSNQSTLEKTEGASRNEHARYNGNIGQATHRMKTNTEKIER
jgi:hypothetical protein